jgi:hypothetical protein
MIAVKPFALIETGHTNVELTPSPIEPSWITGGNPQARSRVLSTSADGLATTMIWSCTEGAFEWRYDMDETIMLLEGVALIESDDLPARRYGPGDVIFFREGARARWRVEKPVRKIAFWRKRSLAHRAIKRLRTLVAG